MLSKRYLLIDKQTKVKLSRVNKMSLMSLKEENNELFKDLLLQSDNFIKCLEFYQLKTDHQNQNEIIKEKNAFPKIEIECHKLVNLTFFNVDSIYRLKINL